MTAYWVTGDTRDVVAQIPDGTVDLVVTSPPFLALRSYLPADHPDKHREIGSEATPAAFTDTLLGLSAEWRRILAPHGSMCVELGDTYDAKCLSLIPELYRIGLAYGINPITGQPSPAGRWKVRNVIRWVRPNPPVGALGDKFRPATSDMVVACTSGKRWFDLDAVRTVNNPDRADEPGHNTHTKAADDRSAGGRAGSLNGWNPAGAPPLDWWQISPGGYQGAHYAVFPAELVVRPIEAMCPRRVCRTCGTPSRRLVEGERTQGANPLEPSMIARQQDGKHGTTPLSAMASGGSTVYTTLGWSSCGCPGTEPDRLDGYHTDTGWRPGRVLDPFAGSGTTGVVATGHSRDFVGIDLDERNHDLALDRIGAMFLQHIEPSDLAGILNPTLAGAA